MSSISYLNYSPITEKDMATSNLLRLARAVDRITRRSARPITPVIAGRGERAPRPALFTHRRPGAGGR